MSHARESQMRVDSGSGERREGAFAFRRRLSSSLQLIQTSGAPRPCLKKPGDGSRAAGDQPRRRHHARLLEAGCAQSCSTCRTPRHSKACATERFYRLACRSVCAARKSPRSRSATCTRTVAMTRCASSARADGAMRLPSTRRRPRACGHLDARDVHHHGAGERCAA